MNLHFSFENSDKTEWLSVVDAYLSVSLIGDNKNVLEIGVWKGGWADTLLNNLSGIEFYGIDPYPGLSHVRDRVVSEHQDDKNFHLFDSVEDYLTRFSHKLEMKCVHIDGEHTEQAVIQDLNFSSKILVEHGFIIVDDFFDRRFPGVTYAIFKLLESLDLRIFLISEQKAYMCRSKFHQEYLSLSKSVLSQGDLIFSEGFTTGSFGETYTQPNSIMGYRHILIREFPNTKFIEYYLKPFTLSTRLKSTIKMFIPPILMTIIRKSRSKFGKA